MLDNLELPNETINKTYDDVAHPAASEVGKFIGRIPRAINAALAPLDKWILQKEHNVVETKKVLATKLESINPSNIVTPEPYVAIPTLQAISYCISSKELYELYANLLAKSMVSDTKEHVHPSFVEIIKQLSPNDALVFKIISKKKVVPAANLSILMLQKGIRLAGSAPEEKISLALISDILIPLVSEDQVRISLDNLMRIGLVQLNDFELKDNASYSFVESSDVYLELLEEFNRLNAETPTADRIHVYRKCISTTSLGTQFCSVCIDGF